MLGGNDTDMEEDDPVALREQAEEEEERIRHALARIPYVPPKKVKPRPFQQYDSDIDDEEYLAWQHGVYSPLKKARPYNDLFSRETTTLVNGVHVTHKHPLWAWARSYRRHQMLWTQGVQDVGRSIKISDSEFWRICCGIGTKDFWPLTTHDQKYYSWCPLLFNMLMQEQVDALIQDMPWKLQSVIMKYIDQAYIWCFTRMSGIPFIYINLVTN